MKLKRIIFLIALSICLCTFVFAQSSQRELFEKGVESLRLEKYQEAVDVLTKFIEIDPEYADVYKNRGVAYMKQKNYDLAIKDFEKAKKILPQLSGVHSNLGVAWYCKKKYGKAIENYSIEINLAPEDYFLYFNRALCYAELGENQKGLKDLVQSLELKPDFYLAICFKGDLLIKEGEEVQAKKAYEKAFIIEPEQIYAKEKLERLNHKEKKFAGAKKPDLFPKHKFKLASQKKTALGKGKFSVQVGAFQNENYALKMKDKLIRNGYDARILILSGAKGKTWYLVRVGLFSKADDARQTVLSLKEKVEIKDAIVRPVDTF